MKRLPLVVAVVLAIPCLVFGQPPAQKAAPAPVGSVAQQIMALEQEWGKADVAQDPAWFERHLADSYVGVDPLTGQEGTKATYLADVRAKNSKYESSTGSDMKVQVFGDVAVVTLVGTNVKATYKEQDRSGKFRWIDTWVRRGGAWRCVASAGAKITAQ
jgi:hypothetical protein